MQQSSKAWLIGTILLTMSIALIAFTSPSRQRESNKLVLMPPEALNHFHFGYRESLADSLWIRVIQDFSLCEQSKNSADGSSTTGRCERGWVFQMVDRITDLAPKFRMAYLLGGTNLSVLVDDKEGARLIFDKALARMPNDWVMAYRAAYHYLIEMKEPQKAADLLVQAGRNGAPQWVFSLAGRLYSDEGRAFLAKTVLTQALERAPDGPAAERIRERLAEVEKDLAQSRSKSRPESHQGRDSAQ